MPSPTIAAPGSACQSSTSPDSLPALGYTNDQLAGYILRQLGSPVWIVELPKTHVLDAINDALNMWSQWHPQIRMQAIKLVRNVHAYLEGVNVGQGITKCDFVEPLPTPTAIFYGNMIDPTPLFKTGMDDYDMFLRWRKMWLRVTSVMPDWYYDEYRKVLWIHNPLERYHASVEAYFSYTRTEDLTSSGAEWVKRYALAKARYVYGDILMKFSGAVPGPAQNLQLDQRKRELAQ